MLLSVCAMFPVCVGAKESPLWLWGVLGADLSFHYLHGNVKNGDGERKRGQGGRREIGQGSVLPD